MSNTPPEDRPGRTALVVSAALLAALTALAGCSKLRAEEPDAGAHAVQPRVGEAQALLDARAAAVLDGRAEEFLEGLAPARARLRDQQRTWFDNLQRLPVRRLSYSLEPSSVVPSGDGRFTATTAQRLQLAGFDAWPVVTHLEMTFAPAASGLVLSAVREPRGASLDVAPPWHRGRVEVVREGGVLGIFDSSSVRHARSVVDAVARGSAEVSRQVPGGWRGSVVVYAFSDTSALRRVPALPGGDADELDAVSFPVGRRAGGSAAFRVVLHPRMLTAGSRERDRLVRHELAHVALGSRADELPVWLSEGLAEYVSVRALAPEDRTIAGAAVAAAREGFGSLPADSTFNGAASQAHYGLAWWACEAIADLYGEEALWSLVDAYATMDDPVRTLLGTTEEELAEEAARRIVAAYG